MILSRSTFTALAATTSVVNGLPASPAGAANQTVGVLGPITVVVPPFTATMSVMAPTTLPPQAPPSSQVNGTHATLVDTAKANTTAVATTTASTANNTTTSGTSATTPATTTPTANATNSSTPEPKKECVQDWNCCFPSCAIGSIFTFGLACFFCLAHHKDLRYHKAS